MSLQFSEVYFKVFVFLCLNVYLFIFEIDESAHRGGAREGGRERIPSRLRAVSAEPSVGLDLTNHKIMT